ncbi:MAG TPA: hypothetical protein VF626_02175, partial [Chthoniobacterales bacterium]
MKERKKNAWMILSAASAALTFCVAWPAASKLWAATARPQLSGPFVRQILSTSAEAPLALRIFTTAVKTDSRGRIITGPQSDPGKNIVGPESAGERAGMERFT